MIIDEAVITVEAGAGGNGCLSFRREKFVPRGGPDGGNGGRGGDVFLEARTDVHTLVDFLYRPLYTAHYGEHGRGKKQHGKDSQAVTIRVPVGTLVWDQENHLIVDLKNEGDRFLIAKGGRGGRGNATFTTSTVHAPKLAERGEPGEKRTIRLELKMLADVGVVGFPNAGKSTLLSRVSNAHPKIADYPFTTLEPQLGVVKLSDSRSFVVADVPGLIEGASAGKGLGVKFLRHLERTKVLLHLIEMGEPLDPKELEKKYKVIRGELKSHSAKFLGKPTIVVLTKLDAFASDDPRIVKCLKKFTKEDQKAIAISAVSGQGLKELMEMTWEMLEKARVQEKLEAQAVVEKTVYRVKSRFHVERGDEGVFKVTGPEVKKWVSMTNFDNNAAVDRFEKILARMGVFKELKRLGLKEGDRLNCEGEEMTYSERQGWRPHA